MAESFLAEILRYVRFDGEDAEALVAFRAVAASHFEAIADAFYKRLDEHEEARRVLAGPAQVARLKVSLRAWLDRLLAGPWDEAYYERRARIGRMHVKVGLPQRYMLTAMSQIRHLLKQVAVESYGSGPKQMGCLCALDKICDVELAIMLETYREDSIDQVTRVERLERDVLQRRLQVTEARYQAIIETAEVLVIAADADEHVVLFNRHAEAILGCSRTDVVDLERLAALFPVSEWDRFVGALYRAREGERLAPFLGRAVARGTELWIRWHFVALAGIDSPLVCAIGVDHSEEKSLEEQTRRAEHLAALGTLAAGLAHEVRNPLNAAQLQLLLVERRIGKITDEAASAALESTELVKAELARLGVLVEDFLAFARPAHLRLESGDLTAAVGSVVGLLEPDLKRAGVRLEVIAPEPVFACYDDERVRQVLHNLIRNAMEAAGEGGSVEVQVLRELSRAVVVVSDDGPGPPDGIELFEPFRTSKDGGTGLGLSIVHRIISDHAGSVDYYRDDRGTHFRVEIPIDGPDRAVA